MKIKISEAERQVLDYLVAQCEGIELTNYSGNLFIRYDGDGWQPTTDWSQGGPIIEREKVCVAWLTKQDLGMEPEHYCVAHIDGIYTRYGPAPLIAAMRCYVASKLGDEVEVPDEIVS